MLRAEKAATTAANANPISSLDNCIAPTAIFFYRIAKCTRDRVMRSRSQRFASRGYADNSVGRDAIIPIAVSPVRCEFNSDPIYTFFSILFHFNQVIIKCAKFYIKNYDKC